jgi:hypothetical protein
MPSNARQRASSVAPPAPSPSIPLSSGVFKVGRRSGPPTTRPIPTAESIAASLVRGLELPAASVLLAPSCGLPVRAASRPSPAFDDQGFSFALRLHAWLIDLGETTIAEAPTYLAPWLAPVPHAIVAMATPGWCAGWILAPVRALTRDSLRQLRDRAFELALSMEESDRAWALAQLASG